MSREYLKISHSENSLNIYFPFSIGDTLNRNKTYSVLVTDKVGGGYHIELIQDKGHNHITYTGRDKLSHPYRLCEKKFVNFMGSVSRRHFPTFGLTEVEFTVPDTVQSDGVVLRFDLPSASELPAPGKRRARNVARSLKSKQLEMPLKGTAVESPHSKLGRILRELNELLASGEVDDVRLELTSLSNDKDEGGFLKFHKPSNVEIKGKLVREETFG